MMKKTKISIIQTDLRIGGAEKANLFLQKQLLKLGYQVDLVLVSKDKTELNCDEKHSFLEGSKNMIYNKIKKFLQLRKYLKQNKTDLIIDGRAKQSFFKELFFMLVYFGIKKIYLVHNYNIDNYIGEKSIFNKWLFRKVDAFATVSKDIEEPIAQRLGNVNIQTVYNAIPEFHNSENVNIAYPYILFFGRLENRSKNFLFMLNSYKKSQLIENNVKLMILGDGKDKDLIIKTINDLKIENFVELRNSVEDPSPYVREALYTILTSNYEGFPRGLIESLALGTPVVSVNFKSGAREIVQHRKNGLLVEKNLDSFAKALDEMLLNQELYVTCKAYAKQSVSQWSRDKIAERWKQLIENL